MADTQINITDNGTKTLLTAGKYCDKNISVSVNVPRENYRRYTGEVTETVKGNGEYTELLKNDLLAELRDDQTLHIIVTFEPLNGLQPYTIINTEGFNLPDQRPWRNNTNVTTPFYYYCARIDSSGVFNANQHDYPLNDSREAGTVGRLRVMSDGRLLIYSNSTNYAIRPGKYTVEVYWSYTFNFE